MESYSANLRLILIANSNSRIIAPIRSRTLLIRVPAPSHSEIADVLRQVASREHLSGNDKLFQRIAQESNRNLRRALLMMEAVYAQNDYVDESTTLAIPDWEVVINQCAREIQHDHSPSTIQSVREKFYALLSHCIPASIVLKTLTKLLLDKTDEGLQPDLVKWAAFYEHRLRTGNKEIFHLEAFVAKFMRISEDYLAMDMVM